jgi:hypothetical protein
MRGPLACVGRKNNAYSDLQENRRQTDDLEYQMYNTSFFSLFFYSKTNYMYNFSSLLSITLHVLYGLPVHHQEFKTVHTASSIWHRVHTRYTPYSINR